MATQVKLFSASGAENFPKLEKEINTWLAGEGAHVQPVNSQTATCALPNAAAAKQGVVVALWYLDPPEKRHERP